MKKNTILATMISFGMLASLGSSAYADELKKTDCPEGSSGNLSSQVIDKGTEAKVESIKEEQSEPRRPFHFSGVLENRP